MFCEKCGKENPDKNKFCMGCGHPLKSITVQEETQTSNQVPYRTSVEEVFYSEESVMPKPKKKVPLALIIGGIVGIVALAAGVFLFMKIRSTVNMNKYMIIEAYGYDGYGTANILIDWDEIEDEYDDKLSFTSKAKKDFGWELKDMEPLDLVRQSVYVEFDTYDDHLSNGDEISYTWYVDENLSDYIKGTIKFKDGTYKVKGLEEVGTFDAFENLEVEFSGVAPFGTVSLDYNGSELNIYDFSIDMDENLSNGDVITVSILDENMEYYAQNLGKIPEPSQKEYTVSGLDSYISSVKEIDDATLKTMQQRASEVFNEAVEYNWGEGEELKSFTYAGNYVLSAKEERSGKVKNAIFLVYKVQVRNTYSSGGRTFDEVKDFYWYARFEDITISSNGDINVELAGCSTPSNTFYVYPGMGYGWQWYYYGYETADDMYEDIIIGNSDLYDCEENLDPGIAPQPEGQSDVPEGPKTDSGYILPNSDTKLLTKDDLEGLSAEECKLARNEIYARHGRKFQDEELQSYFNGCDWYEGTIEPDDFQESMLSDVEIENKNTIVEFEKEKGYR